jgi:hypothetical protein
LHNAYKRLKPSSMIACFAAGDVALIGGLN